MAAKNATRDRDIDQPREEVAIKVYTAEVIREPGAAIIVPQTIPLRGVIDILTRVADAEEEMVEMRATIDVYPWDGAYALFKALQQMFGFSHQVEGWKDTGGFFPEKIKRSTIQVAAGAHGETVGVPWGRFEVPGLEGTLDTGYTVNDHGRVVFQVEANIKGKYKDAFNEIVRLAREIVRAESIYKGHALNIQFTNEKGQTQPLPPIQFVDVSTAPTPIFSRHIEEAIHYEVMAYVEHPDMVRKLRGSLKRGVLLAGTFGCGKTMVAGALARAATGNGFTFIYCRPVDIPRAIDFAIQYAPAVIFAEDLDLTAVSEVDGRTDAVHQLLNKLDGIDTKDRDIMCVFTTNYPEKINQAILRPGRIDAIIPIDPPDAEASIRVARLYARNGMAENEDFSEAGEQMAQMIPAVISEAVGRAQIRAAMRTGDQTARIGNNDLAGAAQAIKRERELFKHEPAKPGIQVIGEAIGGAFGEHVARAIIYTTTREVSNGAAEPAKV